MGCRRSRWKMLEPRWPPVPGDDLGARPGSTALDDDLGQLAQIADEGLLTGWVVVLREPEGGDVHVRGGVEPPLDAERHPRGYEAEKGIERLSPPLPEEGQVGDAGSVQAAAQRRAVAVRAMLVVQ